MSDTFDDEVEVDINKRADVLQATFEHFYGIAMAHHEKAATTSNILLVIVGALFVLVGLDEQVCPSPVDIGSAIGIMIIGAFGAVWARKQHERYHYWRVIASEYQDDLQEIVVGLKTRSDYDGKARDSARRAFGSTFAETLKDRHLWVSLHLIVAGLGAALLLWLLLGQVGCQA